MSEPPVLVLHGECVWSGLSEEFDVAGSVLSGSQLRIRFSLLALGFVFVGNAGLFASASRLMQALGEEAVNTATGQNRTQYSAAEDLGC